MSIYSIFPLFAGVFTFGVGLLVLLKSAQQVRFLFPLLCLAVAIWLIGHSIIYATADFEKALLIFQIDYIGVILIAPFSYHFVISFLKIKNRKTTLVSIYLITFFFISQSRSEFFIAGLYKYYWGYQPKAGPLHNLFLLFFFIIMSWVIYLLYSNFKKEEIYSPIERMRIKYVMLAYSVSIFASSDFLPNYGIEFYPLGFICIVFHAIFTTYAIIRYRLMDINIAIKRTAVYSISAGLLTGLFIVFVLTMTELLSDITGLSSFAISIISALIIALIFAPLKARVQKIVDRVFYKKTYDYYATVQKVSHDLALMTDAKDMYRFITDTAIKTLNLKCAHLLGADAGDYRVICSILPMDKSNDVLIQHNKIDENSELVNFIKGKNDIIIKEELPMIIDQKSADIIAKELKPFNGEVIVPIFIDNKLAFLLILGDKSSGEIFSNEDINLLRTISNQVSISIKNARLYQEKLHSERLVSVGMTAAILAHEIKNPLSSMKIFTQLLPERYDDREFREAFTRIIPGEVERIDGLVTELLDFSRPVPLKIKSISTSALLDDILEVFKGKFEENGIRIIRDYKNNYDIAGDPNRLKQALMNIIMNSYHAMDYNGVLKVSTNTEGGYADILIEDNGNGIMPEDIDRIFDPFFTTKHNGSGLGLSISKKIIQDHKGQIRVTSNPSKGTTFVITLPLYRRNWNGAFSAS